MKPVRWEGANESGLGKAGPRPEAPLLRQLPFCPPWNAPLGTSARGSDGGGAVPSGPVRGSWLSQVSGSRKFQKCSVSSQSIASPTKRIDGMRRDFQGKDNLL